MFKNERTIEANFHVEHANKLLVIMTVYGYAVHQHDNNNKHNNKQRNLMILNPPAHQIENQQQQQQQQEFHKFWIGIRRNNDEELLYTTKKSTPTLDRTTHKLDIDIQFEYFITYVGVAVNVSKTKKKLKQAKGHFAHIP